MTKLRRPALLLATSAAAMALAACGSSATKSSSSTIASTPAAATPTTVVTTTPQATTAPTTAAVASGPFNSCSVVTSSEAAAAIGGPVSAGVLGNATVEGGLACVFYGSVAPTQRDPDVAQTDSVRVVVVEGSDALKWYDDYKGKVAAQSVAGFGNQAYYDGYASFSVLEGDVYLRIAVSPAGAAPSLADEKELATALLPSL